MARGPIKSRGKTTRINPNSNSGGNSSRTYGGNGGGPNPPGKRLPNVPTSGGKGNGVNASSLADVERVSRKMQQEKNPGTNEFKWFIFPRAGRCESYGNMCEPSCPGDMFTVGWCQSDCIAWGTDEQIEDQCGDSYGSCSGSVRCFVRNMTH
jgi:hypothetical protein